MFVLGVNYWPRRSSLDMYREMNLDEVGQDLEEVKNLGFNAVRMFVLLRDFVDENGDLDERRIEFLKKVDEKAAQLGLALYPTLLTIHMSGRNWGCPFIKRSLYSLESLDVMQVVLAKLVNELKNLRSVKGWVLCNELSLVEEPPSAESYRALVRSLALVVKALDESRPLGLGDLIPFVPGTDPESLNTLPIDFVDLHVYNYDNDEVRQSLFPSALASLFLAEGKTVIVEELGCSSALFDEESRARFVNVVLHSLLSNGVSGAFVWCFADYPPEKEHLFEDHPHELRFGVLREDGSPKPVASIIRSFSQLLDLLEKEGVGRKYVLRPREVAVVLPKRALKSAGFRDPKECLELSAALESYVLFKGVSAPATLIYEPHVLGSNYKLYALPSLRIASVSTWRYLKSRAMEGAVVYASIARLREEAHGAPSHVWEELFGVRPRLRACSIGKAVEGPLIVEFVEGFGSVKRGDRIRVRSGRRFDIELFLWEAEPVNARVIATLPNGSPAILLNNVGRGSAILSLIPFEALLATNDVVDRSSGDLFPLYELYRSLATLAGISIRFESGNPRVELEYFEGRKGWILFVINHSYADLENVVVRSSDKIRNVDKLGGDASLVGFKDSEIELRMPSRSVAVLKVS